MTNPCIQCGSSRNLSSLRVAQIDLYSFGNLFSFLTRLYSLDRTCGPSPGFSSWSFHLDCYVTSQLAPFYILHIPRFRSRTSRKSIFFSSRNVPVKIRRMYLYTWSIYNECVYGWNEHLNAFSCRASSQFLFLYCIYVLCGLRTSISHKTNNDWIRIYRECLELVWFSNNYTILHSCRASLYNLFLSDRGSDYRSRASKGRERNSILSMRLTSSI